MIIKKKQGQCRKFKMESRIIKSAKANDDK